MDSRLVGSPIPGAAIGGNLEELHKDAPGVEYNAPATIAQMQVYDPCGEAGDQAAPDHPHTIKLKEQSSGSIIETWNAKKAA